MQRITVVLLFLLPLSPLALAQTAVLAQRPAPNWGAPAAAPAAAPGVPAPHAPPNASAPLPKALQRPELAIVALCWPTDVPGRGCGPVLGEPAERAQGLMRVPMQSGYQLQLDGVDRIPPTAPRGARSGGIAIDPKSCRRVVPIVVTVANVGNATFKPVPGYWPSVGFYTSQGGQGGPNSGVDIKQTLAPGQSVTLRIVDQPFAAGDYDIVLLLHFDDGTGRRRVDYSGRLRVRC
jgi:hypothetical protein